MVDPDRVKLQLQAFFLNGTVQVDSNSVGLVGSAVVVSPKIPIRSLGANGDGFVCLG